MGAALFPLLFVPLTENTGRMPGYFVSYCIDHRQQAILTNWKVAYIVFELFLFGSAFADNFATLVVTRFFGGGASSVSINIVGGSISDVWKGDKARSLPMSIFGFTSVAGIALLNLLVQTRRHLGAVVMTLLPYSALAILFTAFVVQNGGITLGTVSFTLRRKRKI